MKALVCTDHGVKLEDRPEPKPGPGEALLAVRTAGICNTDLEIARGYMGFRGVLGHEVLGEIVGVGPDTELPDRLQGQRVVSEINCSCHRCATCLKGDHHHCDDRTVLGILGRDGGLAERVAVPVANLHAVPDEISDEAATFVEPLAAAIHALDDAPLRPGDRVLLIGDGKLGLLIGLSLSTRGDLGGATVLGRHTDKLAIAKKAGLDVAFDADFDRTGFDVVIEASGHASGLTRALGAVRPRGTIVLKSTYANAGGVDLAPIVINEIRVVGSRCGTFPRAIDAMRTGRIDPTPLIAETAPLSDGQRAFERAAEPGALKVLVRVGP